MKVLSVVEAQGQLDSVCQEALAGEVIRLRLANGALVELLPVPQLPRIPAATSGQLDTAYDDAEWARFENGCAQSSD